MTVTLVTGANKGLGLETARQLARLGHTVVLGSRDAARGARAAGTLAAEGLTVLPLRLDVTDAATVAASAAEIDRRWGRLDVLVNNAGIAGGFDDRPSAVRPEQLREVFETNVVGVVAVTHAMLPLLRRSAAGRIVNVSSTVGSLTLNADPGSPLRHLHRLSYQSSKAALNALTVSYAKQLRAEGILVNSANPGLTATDINGHRGDRTPEQGAAVIVALATLGPDGPTGTSRDEAGTVPW